MADEPEAILVPTDIAEVLESGGIPPTIAAWRQRLDLKQGELAAKINLASGSLSYRLSGRQSWAPREIAEVFRALAGAEQEKRPSEVQLKRIELQWLLDAFTRKAPDGRLFTLTLAHPLSRPFRVAVVNAPPFAEALPDGHAHGIIPRVIELLLSRTLPDRKPNLEYSAVSGLTGVDRGLRDELQLLIPAIPTHHRTSSAHVELPWLRLPLNALALGDPLRSRLKQLDDIPTLCDAAAQDIKVLLELRDAIFSSMTVVTIRDEVGDVFVRTLAYAQYLPANHRPNSVDSYDADELTNAFLRAEAECSRGELPIIFVDDSMALQVARRLREHHKSIVSLGRAIPGCELALRRHLDLRLPEYRVSIALDQGEAELASSLRSALATLRDQEPTTLLSTYFAGRKALQAGDLAKADLVLRYLVRKEVERDLLLQPWGGSTVSYLDSLFGPQP